MDRIETIEAQKQALSHSCARKARPGIPCEACEAEGMKPSEMEGWKGHLSGQIKKILEEDSSYELRLMFPSSAFRKDD